MSSVGNLPLSVGKLQLSAPSTFITFLTHHAAGVGDSQCK